MRNIYTTKIIEICINHNNDYYTIIELDYVPTLSHSKSSNKKKKKKKGLLSTFSLFSLLFKNIQISFSNTKSHVQKFFYFWVFKKNQTTYNLMITKWILKESIQLSQNYLPKRYIDFFFFFIPNKYFKHLNFCWAWEPHIMWLAHLHSLLLTLTWIANHRQPYHPHPSSSSLFLLTILNVLGCLKGKKIYNSAILSSNLYKPNKDFLLYFF